MTQFNDWIFCTLKSRDKGNCKGFTITYILREETGLVRFETPGIGYFRYACLGKQCYFWWTGSELSCRRTVLRPVQIRFKVALYFSCFSIYMYLWYPLYINILLFYSYASSDTTILVSPWLVEMQTYKTQIRKQTPFLGTTIRFSSTSFSLTLSVTSGASRESGFFAQEQITPWAFLAPKAIA